MDYPSADERPIPVLSRRAQWRLAGGLVAVVIALWLAPAAWRALAPQPHSQPPRQADDGSFQATDRQWETLRFAPVRVQPLGDSAQSDGKIAVDDDLTTPVFSPFTGQVTRIFVKAGDRVAAGQPLFAVAASEAAQSDADIATAAATLRVARANEARLKDLAEHKGAALKDWQQSQADLVSADAALAAARGRRKALGSSITQGQGVVRSPAAGVVAQRLIGIGQNVSSATGSGATQAFTISNFSRVWLVGNLREEDAARAHVGQIALVRLAGSNEVLRTALTYVAPTIDPATRRLTVRGEIANPDGHLKPETYAGFTLITGKERQGVVVPEEAVIFEGQTARVWVADTVHHRLALRPISTGQVAGGEVEVTGGLKAGEVVVTAGSLFIDRGARAD